MHKQLKIIVLIVLLFTLVLPQQIFTQFYNGHQMTFGKNRVQYHDYYWQFYRFDKFDAYFHDEGDDLAAYTSKLTTKLILEVENFFGYSFEKRLIFIIYNTQSDFKQSNIGLVSGNEESNTGGTMKIIDNKVFLYFEGDYKTYTNQIKAAITEILLIEMIYGGNFREKVTTSTLINMPEWYFYGLISYVSRKWDLELENYVKDGLMTGKFEKFNRLTGEDAIYAGHSIWNYIAETYGEGVIPNIVYMARVNRNIASGFYFVLGRSLKEITPEWLDFYNTRYEIDNENTYMPDSARIIRKAKKRRVYQQIKMSPDGKYIAFTSNEEGKYIVWLYNTETERKKKIYKRGHKLEQITDYSFPVLAWHPKSSILAFIVEEKGKLLFKTYDIDLKEHNQRRLLYFEKILDFSYSHDGQRIVISGLQKNLIDLYVYTFVSGASERLTTDLADDLNPRFLNNSNEILFSSNRLKDTLIRERGLRYAPVGETYDLFIYDYKSRSPVLKRITDSKYANEIQSVKLTGNIFSFLSDENGVYNRHIAKFDSTISYIDTTTHYSYFTKSYPLTNYSRNIESHDVNLHKKKYVQILFGAGRNHLLENDLSTKRDAYHGKYENTVFQDDYIKQQIRKDSLAAIKKDIPKKKIIEVDTTNIVKPPDEVDIDTIRIDINNYVFDREKYKNYYRKKITDSLNSLKKQNHGFLVPIKRIYQTAFYTDYLVNQVDFGFLNSSYQAFTGGPFYFNPGFNLLFKVGIHDLFEDYKVTGGIRLSGDFKSNEYVLSVENLKKRLDKQILFHQQGFKRNVLISSMPYIQKVVTQEFMYILKYPLSQVSAIKATSNVRFDKAVIQTYDNASLQAENTYRIWGSLKFEYIFDNTRSLGLNLYEGTRSKIFIEAYRQIYDGNSNLYVLGADFRNYIKIHRNFIWANRIAASSSFGKSKLVYYLGGVDNWINYPGDSELFDQSVNINQQEDYVYQAVATNMRGFRQNVRNGTNFIVFNSELRWPIIRYFANKPLNSDFLNNFQIVGFADVGTAFCGSSPYDSENAYNKTNIDLYPVSVVIDNEKPPFVGGFGFGLRSRLFGYFIRTDWAWGVDNYHILPNIFYLSLILDF